MWQRLKKEKEEFVAEGVLEGMEVDGGMVTLHAVLCIVRGSNARRARRIFVPA